MTQPPAVTFPAHELERRRAHLVAEIRRGRTRRVVPLAAVAAVLVALAVTLPGQIAPSRMTLVDQALAAFGRGSTIHVVLEIPNAAALLDLRTGKTRPLARRAEFWTDPRLGSVYSIDLGGVLTQRLAASRTSWAAAAAQWRPFVAGYRRRLERGAYHVVSRGRIRGTPVIWIAASALADGRAQEIAVSTTTYKPLYLRTLIGGRVEPGSGARVVVAETTAAQPSVFAHSATSPMGNGGWTHTRNGQTGIATTIAAARASMSPDPIITARRIAGLRRTWTGLPDYLLPGSSSYRDQVKGLSLYYGKVDDYGYPTYAGSFVSINEITSARAARLLLGPGYFREGKAVITPARPGGPAMAAAHIRGLYVIVEASSAANATAAVRALSR
jgi:phage gp37-like protein